MCTRYRYLIAGMLVVGGVQSAQRSGYLSATPGVTVTIVKDQIGDKYHNKTLYNRLYHVQGNGFCEIRSLHDPEVQEEQKHSADEVAKYQPRTLPVVEDALA